MLGYIVDYSKDRTDNVKYYGGSRCHFRAFYLGTPRGNCISPFLFNLITNLMISKKPDYICPMPYPKEVQIVSYADDIAIICNHKNKFELIQQALATLDQHCRVLGLNISADKTRFVRYTTHRHAEHPHFTLQGTDMERVASFKYRGLVFDEKMKFVEHGGKIVSKISKKIDILKSLARIECGINTSNGTSTTEIYQ